MSKAMEGNVYQPGNSPGAMVAMKPAAPADPDRYETGKGCLVLSLILVVLTAMLVAAIMLGNDQPGLM